MDLVTIIQGLHDFMFGSSTAHFATSAQFYLINFFAKYAVFAFLFSVAMIIVVILYAVRYNNLREKMMARVRPPTSTPESTADEGGIVNPKWKLVQEHINSGDASKWKLAIIEADIILADVLETMHLPGDSIGEKLKVVDTNSFTSIEEAWEAHKIRNAIAHEGSDFLISEREAKRVIGLYQKVFEEFRII